MGGGWDENDGHTPQLMNKANCPPLLAKSRISLTTIESDRRNQPIYIRHLASITNVALL